ncbi:hypothetical protein VCUG_02093 [Vavraia culicis subsp. floridensis]|uniref:Uncharacterized protein n=1 Tax=Vavraia culicis (isolate floridensis) TaxID=948595 RepID=L2GTK4_VAVCU|nr:uncharacterized protein VCUG_02093 [Vavraia culicis subsp. floridensis]ELA46415.1 hypothetical protein VCUG_02093 [Vavraia culicis subsp. floridensis]
MKKPCLMFLSPLAFVSSLNAPLSFTGTFSASQTQMSDAVVLNDKSMVYAWNGALVRLAQRIVTSRAHADEVRASGKYFKNLFDHGFAQNGDEETCLGTRLC